MKIGGSDWFSMFKMIQNDSTFDPNWIQLDLISPSLGFPIRVLPFSAFTLTLRLRLVVPMPQVTSQRSQRPQSLTKIFLDSTNKFQSQQIATISSFTGCYDDFFWTNCRTIFRDHPSEVHETQDVTILHTIRPQAPLWNQLGKKESARVQQTSEDHL